MIRKQDDFYDAINAEWAETAVIPSDKPRTGGFSDLADEIEELMLNTTADWQAGQDVPTETLLNNFVKYHHLTSDWDQRDKTGVAPILPLIEKYKAMASWEDFANQMADLEEAGLPNALPFGVAPDFKNAQLNVLWADALGTILPDTTYYEPDHPQAADLLAKWRESQEALLMAFGFADAEIKDILDKVLAYDARIAKYVLSNEEGAEYAKLYHPYAWDDFTKLVPGMPLDAIMMQLIGEKPDMVVVPEERFWQHAAEFYSEEAWPLLKATLILGVVNSFTSYLSNEIRVLSGAYGRHLSGTPEAISQEKAAYYLASGPYNQALGLWYADKYFSPEAKADVEKQVAVMIDVYKNRLDNIDWLAPETREKAQVKLGVISAHIGYPDKLPVRYYDKVIQDDDTLFSVANRFRQQDIAYHWSKWHQPVDRTEWHMSAHQVNAYYNPQQNQIVFPAAILQAPFYSLEQSASANYGGIGTVIAHEISHAFDTNGASFDEYGSLNNWWTDEDYAAFKTKTDQVVAQFDGLDAYSAKVNGKLTVSENVADLGGVAAALEATEREADADLVAFFDNWAKIWRMKARPEYMQLLVASDVHAPAKLRTNVTMSNFGEFYTTYDVQPSDGMYRAPEDRVMIW
ncbi:M13 family metallopeptidase [Weissella tructae]|uniref:PepO protein n=2 Tax=Weissella TaxID=46255 RepID=A0A075U7N7_9LACO|nr:MULTISPECIES: M13-type metalloendopeptidase [Weissella]AIG66107.1 PepO protein [Weissella tructae]AIM63487.1 PepO protein [Weissella ceti]AIM64822.2 PepO protein [Weissella ceti]ELA07480.1 putative endopeptidase [Weissella ceti NC36]QVV91257.1 endopeptidase [Weissella tructae]